jgi:FixJ family two-component response regulator
VLAQPELAYQQGAFAYLKKPIEQSDLLKALARAEKAARAGA